MLIVQTSNAAKKIVLPEKLTKVHQSPLRLLLCTNAPDHAKFHSTQSNEITLDFGCLGSIVAKALDLQLAGCELNSRPGAVE